MEKENKIKEIKETKANSDYYPGGLERPFEGSLIHLPWWGPFVILVVIFVILKKIIYIKDGKRHGK